MRKSAGAASGLNSTRSTSTLRFAAGKSPPGKDAVFADTGEIFNERSDRVRKAAAIVAGAARVETVLASPSPPAGDPELQRNGYD